MPPKKKATKKSAGTTSTKKKKNPAPPKKKAVSKAKPKAKAKRSVATKTRKVVSSLQNKQKTKNVAAAGQKRKSSASKSKPPKGKSAAKKRAPTAAKKKKTVSSKESKTASTSKKRTGNDKKSGAPTKKTVAASNSKRKAVSKKKDNFLRIFPSEIFVDPKEFKAFPTPSSSSSPSPSSSEMSRAPLAPLAPPSTVASSSAGSTWHPKTLWDFQELFNQMGGKKNYKLTKSGKILLPPPYLGAKIRSWHGKVCPKPTSQTLMVQDFLLKELIPNFVNKSSDLLLFLKYFQPHVYYWIFDEAGFGATFEDWGHTVLGFQNVREYLQETNGKVDGKPFDLDAVINRQIQRLIVKGADKLAESDGDFSSALQEYYAIGSFLEFLQSPPDKIKGRVINYSNIHEFIEREYEAQPRRW